MTRSADDPLARQVTVHVASVRGRRRVQLCAIVSAFTLLAGCTGATSGSGHHSSGAAPTPPSGTTGQPAGLSSAQVTFLRDLAARTWKFFADDLDPHTHLPRNNVVANGPTTHGDFTSPTEIGLFLGALVAAKDLGLADAARLTDLATQELSTLRGLRTYHGFLLRWYRASTGEAVGGPTGRPLTSPFVSTVDDAWYAQGLVLARDAFPTLHDGYSSLLAAMNFNLVYDKAHNQLYAGYHVNASAPESTPTDDPNAGQPSTGDYKLLYGGTRIADYMAVGTHSVPGSLMWGLQAVPTSAQRQRPVVSARVLTDPQSGAVEHVTDAYYVYEGIKFVPTFAGSMFQALAPALVAPELALSPSGLGLNDRNTVLAQVAYASASNYPVWGLAPASTPKRLNGYAQYGADALAAKPGAVPHDAVTPYASALALPVAPGLAADNLSTLAQRFPDAYTARGFLDSVDPLTGRVSGRYMAVSQAVILMSIDNALDAQALTRRFGNDPVGQTLAPYLQIESLPLR